MPGLHSAKTWPILPDLTHYDIFLSPRLVPAVLPFLNGESAAP